MLSPNCLLIFNWLSSYVGIEFIVYVISSLVFAIVFGLLLRRHYKILADDDNVPIDDTEIHKIAFAPLPLAERQEMLNKIEMKKMLRGSIFYATFPLVIWVGMIIFFTGDLPVHWGAAIVFGFIGGFALAISSHNIVKICRRLKI